MGDRPLPRDRRHRPAGPDRARRPLSGGEPEPVLVGDRVRLRRLRPGDRPELRRILAQPEVARWWDTPDPDRATEEWLAEEPGTTGFAIEADGRLVGSIQYAEEDAPGYRHAGIDLFLDRDHQGRGLGPDAIRAIARYLFEVRGHHRLTIDPAAANDRAIRAYERVGFRPVGIMRRYELGPDGTWHDGLLMDLLAGELRA
ncbi:MAG TPA: GNAT family protein [Candidatus Binatus sp.]|nr:GNAT family protein [Candidatus Binatus sp.]